MTANTSPLESRVQKQAADLLNALGVQWLHIPNGGRRVKKKNKKGQWYSPEAKALKAQGVIKGPSDNFILTPPPRMRTIRGVWNEVKRAVGGSESVHQKEWGHRSTENGYYYAVTHGFPDTEEFYLGFLGFRLDHAALCPKCSPDPETKKMRPVYAPDKWCPYCRKTIR